MRPVPEPGTPGNPVHLGVGGTPVYTPYPTRALSHEEVLAIQRRFASMAVRAKFYVSEVKQSRNHYGGQEGEILTTIKLQPVTGTSDENKQFFRWTPAGSIDLGTVNPAVVEQFHIGDEFYIDFTPTQPQQPAD